MPIPFILLAILVAAIWGVNFIFIKFGLLDMPPLFLCAMRFFLASIPALFFIKLPAVPFRMIFLYGMIMFALQFSLMFVSMNVGMTPGLAALLIQIQMFFSIFFAALFLREIPNHIQILGGLISFTGIGVAAMHFDTGFSFLGFILMIAAAATWGVGNLVTKKIGQVNMISLVVWGSFVAFFPLMLLSFLVEGLDTIIFSLKHMTWLGIGSLFYIVYMSTWVGYGAWCILISRYSIAMVVPFTLLVPIFGMASSILILNEPLQSWKLVAGLLVIAGLALNVLGTRFFKKKIMEPAESA